MDKVFEYVKQIVGSLDFQRYATVALVLIVGSLVFGATGRFVFGKRSMLGSALSSAIAVVFLYALTVALLLFGGKYAVLTSPLPFVTVEGEQMWLFTFTGKDYPVICAQLLNMVILAFTVSLADRFLPRGKNPFSWLFFRVLTVALGFIAHSAFLQLLAFMVPNGYSQYAPTILLGILVIMLLTGALKILIGLLISTVNPIVAALYTFFFANAVGRQLTRSVLTTAFLTLVFLALEHFGVPSLALTETNLVLYIPYGAGLLGLWYLSNRIF